MTSDPGKRRPPSSTDVLVVGGGPTGLALSLALTQLGVDHVVVERQSGPAPNSRAAALHARTLESLAAVGAADALVAAGRPGRAFAARDGDRVLLQTPFNAVVAVLRQGLGGTSWPLSRTRCRTCGSRTW